MDAEDSLGYIDPVSKETRIEGVEFSGSLPTMYMALGLISSTI